ncbi:hypothetical protein COR50_10585 [Chitinophaga caeni]|uniref:Peptidase M56 domain-containing protein n=1 Tax=Chitinophaga caeni TaxID=2029983 RepID=A0A291QUD6_9BACT|nr:M56 family metallopeptidase [Chitinophaga caeni]ATL47578.1 hypothetical protein COR50_10585 [Chitinophaga caeni]
MPTLFIYLLKANVALSLFYLVYRLALRKLTFYTLNRVFLVSGIVFSSLFPLVDVNAIMGKHEELVQQMVVYIPDLNALQDTMAAPSPFTVWYALAIIFWAGVVLMMIRLIIQLTSLLMLHLKTRPGKVGEDHVRITGKTINPFSFFRHIYVNPSLHSQHSLDAILLHEKIHVKEWHSLDVLLGELNQVFYWFNPGAWLMKGAIKENLEFITDRRMLRSGVDIKAYQYSLLQISGAPYATAIANNFNFSHLKKRIMMMNKQKSSRYNIARYVLFGGVVSLGLLAMNISKATVVNATESLGTIVTLKITDNDSLPGVILKKDEHGVISLNSNWFGAKGSDDDQQPLTVVDGKPLTQGEYQRYFNKHKNESHYQVKVVKAADAMKVYGDKAMGGALIIDSHKGDLALLPTAPPPPPAPPKLRVAGAPSAPAQSVPAPPATPNAAPAPPPPPAPVLKLRGVKTNGKNPDYYINDMPASEAELSALDPNSIEAIYVFKDSPDGEVYVYTKEFIAKGGKPKYTSKDAIAKAKENKGVLKGSVESLTISGTPAAEAATSGMISGFIIDKNTKIQIRGNKDAQPIYVVDGIIIKQGQLKDLKPDDIESITVLKEANATALYGEAAKDGVIVVATKKNASK